ncbi:serine hydrolase domain-containing protein [Paenibacillus tengchongensis]|uniref:serine hydrolase domain-containing protein n=1 Tax=Paenibacillus tengchongensis TaxID=2608684 RepID=UPI00124D5FEC|nr:serine hydrolase domain-containing protein [Paenibacillus tengchongensis]
MISVSEQINSYLSEYGKVWPFSGNVLVAKEGEILHRGAYGCANVELQVPNNAGTRFRIWSVTKSFTAMGVMLLFEQGLLHTANEISSYLPELELKEITVAQLLNHTSGLANYSSMPRYNNRLLRQRMAPEEVLELFIREPLASQPGTSFAYNNSGYFLLGLLIERLSGMSYREFIHRHILQPLNMADTGFDDNRTLIPGMASSYQSNWDQLIPCEYMDMSSIATAGSMYSTVDDLYKWDQALYTDKLVSPETLETVFTPVLGNYGYGWFIDEHLGRSRIHHGGAYRGCRSELHRYPGEQLTVIMLTNYDIVPVYPLTERLAGMALGQEVPLPVRPEAVPADGQIYKDLTGTYEGYGCRAEVKLDGNQFYFIWNEEQAVPLYPLSETRFHSTWYDWECSFERSGQGQITFLGMDKTKE